MIFLKGGLAKSLSAFREEGGGSEAWVVSRVMGRTGRGVAEGGR